ncbi:GNAT family N-acetyltransferase [Oricola cellulosilytica]|uniref:GNAT family N-acetyltransferase n=1 Tax=Oricola cellulosilytica TaxID=1429082 RepID=A0A4R0PC90_9HYPH|nr:GNAT family N-acetyltransferase [Oricola cellulosilytica]TCD14078.1 GNAT family N-acetyltransferase [Oricola cellulosilytica]
MIALVENEDQERVAKIIERELLSSLAAANTQTRNETIVLASRGDDGTLRGGLTASTSYGWLLIKTLWVEKRLRGRGLGQALVKRAEEEGRLIGCHGAWLDTSNPAAKAFYAGLGYEVFGVLENVSGQVPANHRRWFMRTAL